MAILSKRMINAQTMLKVRFYLDKTPNIDNEKFLITARKAIEALHLLYSFLLKQNTEKEFDGETHRENNQF